MLCRCAGESPAARLVPMSTFRFLHAADVHLDSPLKGLDRFEGAPEQLRLATREAFVRMVDLAVEEQVAVVILAGDLYDGTWKDYRTGLFFLQQMGRLGAAGIRSVVLRGNHDAENKMTKSLRAPEGVHTLDAKAPESVAFEDLGLVVHGQSFKTAAVTANLAKGYPDPVAGAVNIGVLHTALEGDRAHAPYAPCSVTELRDKGYDYWALGHVHARRIVSEEPWIVYPGNTQGRHALETGAKGCYVVDVVDGVVQEPTFHTLDVVRWQVVTVDASELDDLTAVLDCLREELTAARREAEDRLLAVRVEITGRSAAHEELIVDAERLRAEVLGVATGLGEDIWIEKVRARTERRGDGEAEGASGATAELLAGMREPQDDDAELVAAALEPIAGKLDAELRDRLLAESDDAAVLRAARELLKARLLRDRGGA